MSKLFIGMPVYNGARYITEAIDSIRNQSFEDWILLISDNFSDDETENICKKYVQLDSRIKYVRQSSNIGAVNNFKFVLDNANSKYFMWAASDDIWLPEFISTCMEKHKEKDLGLVFTNIINPDAYSNIVRDDYNLDKIIGKNKILTALKFLADPEICGKANIIYGIYQTSICKEVWCNYAMSNNYASDVSFVYGIVSRKQVAIDDKVLFYKRHVREDDDQENPRLINVQKPLRVVFALKDFLPYTGDLIKAAKGLEYKLLVILVMIFRLPRVIFYNIKYQIK